MNRGDEKQRYLGDGVYLSHDGYQLWLNVDGRAGVALDSDVYMELRREGDEFYGVKNDK